MGNSKKKHSVTHFLIGSFIGLIVFSIMVFSMLGIYMSRKSNKAINEVAQIYMSGMNEQMSRHFQTVIQLRFDQVSGVVSVVSTDNKDRESLYEELTYRAQVRGFDYLALCSAGGDFQTLYGRSIQPLNPEPFVEALLQGEQRVAVGVDADGNEVVLFGVDAAYPMHNGHKSTGLIAAIPLEYITDFLSLEDDGQLMYYHIIRPDGSFVIQNPNTELWYFFEQLQKQLNATANELSVENSIKEFEKKYNIKVNMETFDDMEAMYQKINSGAGKYDVVLVSDALMPRMIEKGLVQKLNKDNIPNISQMDKQYLDLDIDPGNQYSVPYMFGTVGLIYNKDVVKEKVDSWDILWDEKYKNRIFMFDTYRDTLGAALKKLGYSLNSENPKEIEEAKELLLEQRKLVDPIYGVDNGTTMIPAGESDINMIWSGEGLNLQDENPNLVYVVPKEGANFWIDSLCIPSNAKNVSGAEKFINFVSDKESALRIADEIGYTTPNKEARLEQPEEVRNNPNAYMPKEIMDRCEIYVDLPKDVKKLYDNAWIQIKSSN